MKKNYSVVLNTENANLFKEFLRNNNLSFETSSYWKDIYFTLSLTENEVIDVNIMLDWLNCRR